MTLQACEFFAGSRSFGEVAERKGMSVVSFDIKPFKGINVVSDILDIQIEDLPPWCDFLWASPPCTYFSVASIGHHWNRDHTPKTENAMLGVRIVEKTWQIIDHYLFINPNLKYGVENPRGKLRKLSVMFGRPRVTVCYCKYGDMRMKPTDIWTNLDWTPRPMCFNGNIDCHHEAAPRGSKTGTQGIKGAYDRSRIPFELVDEILGSLSRPAITAPLARPMIQEVLF